jgi:hypothetical protein
MVKNTQGESVLAAVALPILLFSASVIGYGVGKLIGIVWR